jgi:hypothetical protein
MKQAMITQKDKETYATMSNQDFLKVDPVQCSCGALMEADILDRHARDERISRGDKGFFCTKCIYAELL